MNKHYWEEYKDLFLKAKKSGDKKMFLFDIANSRQHSSADPEKYVSSVCEFVDGVTATLMDLENTRGYNILHRHKTIVDDYDKTNDTNKVILLNRQNERNHLKPVREDSFNPNFFMGDTIYFIVGKNSITDHEFYDIAQKQKDESIPGYDLHFAHGCYETDAWSKGSEKLARSYCIPILEYLSKEKSEIMVSKTNECEPRHM